MAKNRVITVQGIPVTVSYEDIAAIPVLQI